MAKSKKKSGGKITHDVKLFPKQRCIVLNYRLRPARWESGVVTNVEVHVDSEGSCRNRYDVVLDRKTISLKEKRRAKYEEGYKPWESIVRLTVGDDAIQAES